MFKKIISLFLGGLLLATLMQFADFSNSSPAYAQDFQGGTSLAPEPLPQIRQPGSDGGGAKNGGGGSQPPTNWEFVINVCAQYSSDAANYFNWGFYPKTKPKQQDYKVWSNTRYNRQISQLPYAGVGVRTWCPFVDSQPGMSTFEANYGLCGPRNGDGKAGTGIFYWVDKTNNQILTSKQCRYPAWDAQPTYKGPVWTCATYWNSTLYQSTSKTDILYGGYPANVMKGTNNYVPNTYYANDPSGKCLNYGRYIPPGQPVYQGVNYKIADPNADSSKSGYGYFRLNINIYGIQCQMWGYPEWTKNTSRDEVRCGGAKNNFNVVYAVNSCDGWNTNGNLNALPTARNFDINGCASFSCPVNGSIQINDTSTPVQVMRNGEAVKITYPTISVSANASQMRPIGGSWNILGGTGVVNGSTPYNSDVSLNNTNQYFKLYDNFPTGTKIDFISSPNGGGSWKPQNDTVNSLKYTWASNDGSSWKAYRSWKITNAEFYVKTVSDTNGSVKWVWVPKVVYCGYVESNPVTVVRSVNE